MVKSEIFFPYNLRAQNKVDHMYRPLVLQKAVLHRNANDTYGPNGCHR